MHDDVDTHQVLAGVCSRLGRALHCNVWALRAGFLLLLLLKPLLAMLAYTVLALLFRLASRQRGLDRPAGNAFCLLSPQLASRSRRLEALDRRIRAWEDSARG
jgi:phage shock protein PspC (stress-responsive transcriptional regulator)